MLLIGPLGEGWFFSHINLLITTDPQHTLNWDKNLVHPRVKQYYCNKRHTYISCLPTFSDKLCLNPYCLFKHTWLQSLSAMSSWKRGQPNGCTELHSLQLRYSSLFSASLYWSMILLFNKVLLKGTVLHSTFKI